MEIQVYLQSLTGKIFKILPMFENEDETLNTYMAHLVAELSGGSFSFPELSSDAGYISLFNGVNYILHHDCSVKQCKREVFNMLSVVDVLIEKYGR